MSATTTEPTVHPERGDLDKMTQKPASAQRELAEARRILNRVIIPRSQRKAALIETALANMFYEVTHLSH